MKIGILTHFHKSNNYGGVLQAYALCKYLNECGHSAFQILYNQNVTKVTSSNITVKELFSKAIKRVKRIINKKKNNDIKERMESNFREFRMKVPQTKREYSRENIAELSNDFDAIITGSDQVWNPIWYDPSYFLDFVGEDTIKLSYAASIGLFPLDKKQEKIIRPHLSDFRSISVREQSASHILSQLTDKHIEVSVDPTLLLSSDDWDELSSERRIKEKYVFLFLLGDDRKTMILAEKFAKAKNLKLVLIPDLLGEYRRSDRKITAERITDATPNDFLSLIKYAEYVITDSFHACLFSLLYKKQFFVFERAGNSKISSRIQNFTELFACHERYCIAKSEMTLEHLLSLNTMNYSKEFDLFEKVKQNSKDYLKTNLK